MPGYGINKRFKTAVQKKMIFIFQLSVNNNNGFLEDIFGIIGISAVCHNEMMNSRIIFLVDILKNGIVL